jgi:tetratricopeptide (TPR) repeat protein
VPDFRGNGRIWTVCLVLVLVTLALYWPARNYDFVEYDDPGYVFENQTVRDGLTGWGLTWAVVDFHENNWHPVTWLSHMLDCQLFGLRAGRHHLVSVLLHGANAALLFVALWTMTGAFWRCAFVAAAFAWQPLRVESVAWISERKDVLSGFFFMLTLWMYALYAAPSPAGRSGNAALPRLDAGRPSRGYYWLALVFLALGLMSKPMLVTTPGVLLLLDYWPLARFAGSNGKSRLISLLREKIPFVVLCAAAGLITVMAQHSGGAMISLKSEPLGSRLSTALVGYLCYLGKFLWPRDLTVLYLRPHVLPAELVAVALAVPAGISAVAIAMRRRPYLVVGWLWFVGMLLPVCGVMQAGVQLMADRYTYLPSIGLLVAAAWAGGELAAVFLPARARLVVPGLAAAVLLAGWAAVTRHQMAYWQNTQTLMEHALQIDPDNYVAHNNLGAYFTRLGRKDEARIHYRRVSELEPGAARDTAGTNNAASPKHK